VAVDTGTLKGLLIFEVYAYAAVVALES